MKIYKLQYNKGKVLPVQKYFNTKEEAETMFLEDKSDDKVFIGIEEIDGIWALEISGSYYDKFYDETHRIATQNKFFKTYDDMKYYEENFDTLRLNDKVLSFPSYEYSFKERAFEFENVEKK